MKEKVVMFFLGVPNSHLHYSHFVLLYKSSLRSWNYHDMITAHCPVVYKFMTEQDLWVQHQVWFGNLLF